MGGGSEQNKLLVGLSGNPADQVIALLLSG